MLKKAVIPWTAKTLSSQIEKGKVSFDCAVQRGYVWDNAKNSLLIHSMIEGYPVPAFYFEKCEDGAYDALDGKQRSNAIYQYMANNYTLCSNFESVTDEEGGEHDFSGFYYESLPEWAQDAIKDYSLTIYYFEGLTDEERDNMFYRLNNGKPLTAIELTRVKAKSLGHFQEMAKHELINLAVTEKGRVRYDHENLTIQAWAICYVPDVSFETKNFRSIVESAEVEQEQVEAINSCFDILLDVYNSYSNDKADTRLKKRIVTRTHTVALTKAASLAIERGYDMDEFIAWAKMFFSGTNGPSISEVYNISCGAGSARRDRINARMGAILESMAEYFEDEEQNNGEFINDEHAHGEEQNIGEEFNSGEHADDEYSHEEKEWRTDDESNNGSVSNEELRAAYHTNE